MCLLSITYYSYCEETYIRVRTRLCNYFVILSNQPTTMNKIKARYDSYFIEIVSKMTECMVHGSLTFPIKGEPKKNGIHNFVPVLSTIAIYTYLNVKY